MRLNHLFFDRSALSEANEKRFALNSLRVVTSHAGLPLVETLFEIGFFSGAYGGAETHVPFPNTVVKGSSGDGTVNLTMGE